MTRVSTWRCNQHTTVILMDTWLLMDACKLKSDTFTYRQNQNTALCFSFFKKRKKYTRLHKTKVKRHSKLFHNHLTSSSLSFLKNFFCQVTSDFRFSAVASRTTPLSLCIFVYLSRWISVCVSPRLSSCRVDSWAM